MYESFSYLFFIWTHTDFHFSPVPSHCVSPSLYQESECCNQVNIVDHVVVKYFPTFVCVTVLLLSCLTLYTVYVYVFLYLVVCVLPVKKYGKLLGLWVSRPMNIVFLYSSKVIVVSDWYLGTMYNTFQSKYQQCNARANVNIGLYI